MTRSSAFLAHFSLCSGGCLLAVATTLVLMHFDPIPDDWKLPVTVVVATMAVVLLSAGVVLLLREPSVDERVRAREHASAAFRETKQLTTDHANPQAGGPTVARERPAAPARSSSFETGAGRHAAPTGPSYPNRSDKVGTWNEAGIGRGEGAWNEDTAARSAAAESTHDRDTPERPGSVAGVETSPPDHAEPAPAVEPEPTPAAEPQPTDLIGAWDAYRRTGDGHFNPRGLQRVLDHRGIGATVSGGERIGVGGSILIVETPARKAHFYVLPSFAKSPRAVADWFDDSSGGALTGRTERVIQVAEGRWTAPGFHVVRRGQVA